MELLNVNITKSGYGERIVLSDIKFSINEGEIVSIIGGNASGKSTLFKAIYGLIKVDEGSQIIYDNIDITNIKTYKLFHMGLMYLPQKIYCFDNMTVEENIRVIDYDADLEYYFDIFPNLKSLRDKSIFHLSGGELKQLGLAMCFIRKPKLLLIDEPMASLSDNNHQLMLDGLKKLNENGTTIIAINHFYGNKYMDFYDRILKFELNNKTNKYELYENICLFN
jgi:branched-chain amino acid transport system ATP-binding protein